MNPILEFTAGIGLFLFAMKQLEESLKSFAGRHLQNQITHQTSTRLGAITTGTVATALLQSSSLVGLIVLALCGAGLLPLFNAIGVMLGANLGTTLTGWLVTFIGFKLDLGKFSLLILGIAALFNVFATNKKLSQLSAVVVSVGILLIGLELMKSSTEGVAELVNIEQFKNHSVVYFLLLGILLSAIIQSSSAVMIITLSALSSNIIELHHAGALVIGADLGTTSTVIIGSLRGAQIKRQLAISHLLFNLLTNLVAFVILLPFIDQLLAFFSITDPLYSLVAFHSLFNLVGIFIFFPWLPIFSRYIEQRIKTDQSQYTQYIDKVPATLPSLALQALNQEVDRLLQLTLKANNQSINEDYANQQQDYRNLKHIEGKIIRYKKAIQQQELTENEAEYLNQLATTTRYAIFSLKSLSDIRDDIQNVFIKHQEFHEMELTQKLFNLFTTTIHSLQELLALFGKGEIPENWQEEVDNLTIDLKLCYLQNQEKIYSPGSEHQLTNIEISTLLNLNKEILTSSQNMLRSVNHYFLASTNNRQVID